MNFEQRVFQSIKKNKLMSPRRLVLAGVSGGADSMALLLSLSALRHELGIELHAAHFNHRLRDEARRDERFVADWCARLNVPLTVGCRQGGKLQHLSEDAARQMRFQFFNKNAQELKAQCVALAHTRNDLAETVLMRLMRGSGLYGLRAILPRRQINGVVFVRPLMELDRAAIEDYLKAKKTPFRHDITNSQTVYERNKIRLKLLPLLAREYNPQIMGVLSDLAATAGEDYDFMERHARKVFEKKAIISGKKIKIDLKSIRRQHPAIGRLVFRLMVGHLTGESSALAFNRAHALEDWIAQEAQGTLELAGRIKAVKTAGFLELRYV